LLAGTTRLAVRTGGTLSDLLGDHIGSSSVTTDANGVKTAAALYKAFGETRFSAGNLGTDYKFTGQREEASLGIYFFNARWFDPSLGRFTSPDTIVPTSTQGTQAWDRYAFVNNNPVRYNDPTGHTLGPWTWAGIVLIVIAAIVFAPVVLSFAGAITLAAGTVETLTIISGAVWERLGWFLTTKLQMPKSQLCLPKSQLCLPTQLSLQTKTQLSLPKSQLCLHQAPHLLPAQRPLPRRRPHPHPLQHRRKLQDRRKRSLYAMMHTEMHIIVHDRADFPSTLG
jgi:RHS repeat-associated protein